MELFLSGAFIALLLAFSATALFLTQKLVDITHTESKTLKYFLGAASSGVIVFGSKVLGVQTVMSFLVLLGYTGNPPPDALGSWFSYIIVFIFTFLVSGGIFDWRKLLTKKE